MRGGNSNNVFNETFVLISMLIPYIVPFYLLMSSFFNTNLKGFIYIILLLINVIITQNVGKFLNVEPTSGSANMICNFGPFSELSNMFLKSNTLSVNSSIILFTLAYLLTPMMNRNIMNYNIITIFLALFSINAFTQHSRNCNSAIGIMLGGLIGFMMGYIMVALLDTTDDMRNFIYFYEQENNSSKCKLSNQKYTCKAVKIQKAEFEDKIV